MRIARLFGYLKNISKPLSLLVIVLIFISSTDTKAANNITTRVLNLSIPVDEIFDMDYSYVNTLNKIPGTSAATYNISKMTGDQVVSLIKADAQNYSSAVYIAEFSGHGDPSSLYTTNGFSMAQEVAIATQAMQQADAQGITVVDCCGSGNITTYANDPSKILGDGENNLAVISSSAPGKVSWVGAGNSVAEKLLYYRTHVSEVDLNGDGVLTVGELKSAMQKDGMNNQFIIPEGNEDAPVFAASDSALQEYKKKWNGLCIVVKPGQDEEFGKMYGTAGVCAQDTGKDINGSTKCTKGTESDLNYELRKENFGCLKSSQVGGSTDAGTKPGCNPDKKDTSNYDIMEKSTRTSNKVTWVRGEKYKSLSEEQARESLKHDKHAYAVPEKVMKPSNAYIKGSITFDADGDPVLVKRLDCKFVTKPSLIPIPSPSPNPGGSGGSSNNEGNQGQGTPNSGNNASSTPTPTPSPSASSSSSSSGCSEIYSPVCDVNGKTQFNRCVAEKVEKVEVANEGACDSLSDEELEEISTTLGDLIKQALTSGVPDSSILGTIRTIISLYEGIISGTSSSVTTE